MLQTHKLASKWVVAAVSLLLGWIGAAYCYKSFFITTATGRKEHFFGGDLACAIAFVTLSFATYVVIMRVVGMLRRNTR